VSLMSKKDGSSNSGGGATKALRNIAAQTTAHVKPAAKSASAAARQGAEGAARWAGPQVEAARSWAEPQVRAARSWAAPRVEQAGYTVRDKIAPQVSAALVEASHRLDATQQQPKPRRWPRLVAAVAMAAAAASAIAAVFLKRQAEVLLGPDDEAANGGATPANGRGDGATRATGESPRGPAPGQTGSDPDDLLP
jgi:hypothetical protein